MTEIFLNAEKIGHIGSFPVTNTLIASITIVLFLLFVAFMIQRTKYNLKSRFYNLVEMIIEGVMGVVQSVVGGGKIAKQIFAVLLTFFIFILCNNWFGIFPGMGSVGIYEEHAGEKILVPFFRSANSDLNMTLAITIISLIFIQVITIANIGTKKYLHKFFNFSGPILFFVGILELLSEFIKIISFSFRLFGNIFAGDVLLIVMFALVPYIIPIPFLGIEIFAGFVQALIFSMLTLVFINVSVSHGEEH